MKQLSSKYFISFGILFFIGCSALSPYEVPVLQGNIVDEEDIEKLKTGLNKDQIRYLLGTPLAKSPLTNQRWDYYYSVKVGDRNLAEKKLTLFFNDQGVLDSWNLEDSVVSGLDDPIDNVEEAKHCLSRLLLDYSPSNSSGSLQFGAFGYGEDSPW